MSAGVPGLLASVKRDVECFFAIAAKAPGATPAGQAAGMTDLVILAGGRPVLHTAGDVLDKVELEDPGKAAGYGPTRTVEGSLGAKGIPGCLERSLCNGHFQGSATTCRPE